MSKIMINRDLICGARASQLFIADTTPGHQWYLSCELYKFGQSPKSGSGSKGSNYSTKLREWKEFNLESNPILCNLQPPKNKDERNE